MSRHQRLSCHSKCPFPEAIVTNHHKVCSFKKITRLSTSRGEVGSPKTQAWTELVTPRPPGPQGDPLLPPIFQRRPLLARGRSSVLTASSAGSAGLWGSPLASLLGDPQEPRVTPTSGPGPGPLRRRRRHIPGPGTRMGTSWGDWITPLMTKCRQKLSNIFATFRKSKNFSKIRFYLRKKKRCCVGKEFDKLRKNLLFLFYLLLKINYYHSQTP